MRIKIAEKDDCGPRRAEDVNGSVHCLRFFMLLLMFYPIILCIFELRSKIGCISEIKINAILKILISLTIKIVYFTRFALSLQPKPKHVRIMTTLQLNNLWTYIQGMALKKKDREWLAGKLLEPTADDAKTAQQKAYVKESLTRALKEVEAAKREGRKLQTLDEFIKELRMEVETV